MELHPTTLYRDLSKLDGEGSTRDIAPAKRGFPVGLSRLHPRQDENIHFYLVNYHLRVARPSLSGTTEKIGCQCEDEGFGRPTRAAVMRRLKRLPPLMVAARRVGRAAAHKATPTPGRLEVTYPRELYQIDHTLADVIVLDGKHLKPIGRVWRSAFAHAVVDPLFALTVELPREVIAALGDRSVDWPADLRRRWTYAAAAGALGTFV